MTHHHVVNWRSNGRHLPDFLKDFHDQKDFFKAMHTQMAVEAHDMAGHIDWMSGHAYVIDCFLWFLARHGYTLQKTKAPIPFDDLGMAINMERNAQLLSLGDLIAASQSSRPSHDGDADDNSGGGDGNIANTAKL